MTSTFVGNDSDKNAKEIFKKAIINNQNAPSQNKLKLTGDIISLVNTLKFSKRNNDIHARLFQLISCFVPSKQQNMV